MRASGSASTSALPAQQMTACTASSENTTISSTVSLVAPWGKQRKRT